MESKSFKNFIIKTTLQGKLMNRTNTNGEQTRKNEKYNQKVVFLMWSWLLATFLILKCFNPHQKNNRFIDAAETQPPTIPVDNDATSICPLDADNFQMIRSANGADPAVGSCAHEFDSITANQKHLFHMPGTARLGRRLHLIKKKSSND